MVPDMKDGGTTGKPYRHPPPSVPSREGTNGEAYPFAATLSGDDAGWVLPSDRARNLVMLSRA